ncbi:hypothetical protein DFP72DRAFT_227191 [Ephemerocybe angulata]|uniref:DUF6533 domain-containing protein n=1 Tax=Ephemerocybe angulata TaxID=980116 RepID=A0A8H6H9U1_9AGAR|nr:hypothetical protein DFP72DRAFT_227191 [Tulosesus angulatus]
MSAIQDLTLEEVADMTALVYAWTMEEYIYLALFSSYIFYYLTTLAEEISIMWPQRWRTGKLVFLVNRYLPLVLIGNSLLIYYRFHLTMSPKVCTGLYIANGIVLYRVMNLAFEVALLLCLYALLGASQICLTLIIATYAGFTLATTILQIGYFGEASRMVPISQIDRELGYACTWEGKVSPKAARRYAMAGYITLVKSIAISALALFIFFVRYRKHRGTLLQVVRRDSGIYILSLSALRLGSAITGTHSPTLSQANSIGDSVLDGLANIAMPILTCRLLLNMRKSEDPVVHTMVSSILFDFNPPQGDEDPADGGVGSNAEPLSMVHYAGLGRRKVDGRDASNTVAEVRMDVSYFCK